MNISIKAQEIKFDKALREQVNAKLYLIFSRYGDQVQEINLNLHRANGPEGRKYVKCLMDVKLANRFDSIVVQDSVADIYDAVSICSQRAKWAVERHFKRVQFTGIKVM